MTIREQTEHDLALKELEDYRAGKFDASYHRSLIMTWGKGYAHNNPRHPS